MYNVSRTFSFLLLLAADSVLRSIIADIQAWLPELYELSLEFELKKLDKYELLILDDIGYVKKTNSESQVLFELITHRYKRNCLLITSNQAFSEWDSIFTDNMMTVSVIDRLIHHAAIYQIEGESYRKKHAMKN